MNNAQILLIGFVFGLTSIGICFLIANIITYFVRLNSKMSYITNRVESLDYQVNSLNKTVCNLTSKTKK